MYRDPQRESRVSLSYTFGMSEEKSVEATQSKKRQKRGEREEGMEKRKRKRGMGYIVEGDEIYHT